MAAGGETDPENLHLKVAEPASNRRCTRQRLKSEKQDVGGAYCLLDRPALALSSHRGVCWEWGKAKGSRDLVALKTRDPEKSQRYAAETHLWDLVAFLGKEKQ